MYCGLLTVGVIVPVLPELFGGVVVLGWLGGAGVLGVSGSLVSGGSVGGVSMLSLSSLVSGSGAESSVCSLSTEADGEFLHATSANEGVKKLIANKRAAVFLKFIKDLLRMDCVEKTRAIL